MKRLAAAKMSSDSQQESNTIDDYTNATYCKGRASEAKEVHHVTFAEQYNKYVNSDSGIVLSPDELDVSCDVIEEGELNGDGCYNYINDDGHVIKALHGAVGAVSHGKPGPPIIKLQKCYSIESQDNPFLLDGELSRKADYILSHSTISRRRIRISDPDTVVPMATAEVQNQITVLDTTEQQESVTSAACIDGVTDDEVVPQTCELVESRCLLENNMADNMADQAETSTNSPLLVKDGISNSPEHRVNGNGKQPVNTAGVKKKSCCSLQ